MKRWKKLILLVLGLILFAAVLLLVLFLPPSKNPAEEYRKTLRAAGEKLDIVELMPARPDPASNGVIIFQEVIRNLNRGGEGALGSNPPPAMRWVAPGKAMVGWQQPDITMVGATNTWDDVESSLAAQADALELLSRLSQSAEIQFELDYRQGFKLLVPHLSKLKQSSQLLSASAIYRLHRGDTPSAVTNVHEALSLINAWKDERLLISQLVRMAMAQITISAQWELLQATNLTAADLAGLRHDFESVEFVKPLESALLMERTTAALTIQQLRTSNSPSSALWGGGSGSSGGTGDFLDDLKEAGRSAQRKVTENIWRVSWSYSDELHVLKTDQILIQTLRQVRTNGFFKDALARCEVEMNALGPGKAYENWLRNALKDDLRQMQDLGVSLTGALKRLLAIEATRAIVTTALAIKEYELKHGSPPPDLNALVPELLPAVPVDPVDGQPLRYRLNTDKTFLLYSIGEDAVDGGGDPASPSGASRNWLKGKDWVWPQPATPVEVQAIQDTGR